MPDYKLLRLETPDGIAESVSPSTHRYLPVFDLRDNAWPLQPGSGPDHPRLCAPGRHGCPVLLCGTADQSQKQTQAQEAPCEAPHLLTAAEPRPQRHRHHGNGQEPHRLIGPMAAERGLMRGS